jgi:heterodisulfide reductase subunit A-like polyferredoxin
VSAPITTRTTRRPDRHAPTTVDADICVIGAGIAGVSAALEAAALGRRVVLVDAAPAIGGQAIGSIVGTIIIAYLVKAVIGLRPTAEAEQQGLDITDHGEEGYIL